MKPTIISLSGYAQNGKTSSCYLLSQNLSANNKRCLRIGYGDYVKYIAEKYHGWNGIKDEAGRTLLQEIGAKYRAANPNFWVNTVIRLIDVMGEDYDYILIDDARFPNEVYSWKQCKYEIKTIHVNRPNFSSNLTDEQKADISETAMDGFKFDYEVRAYDLFQLRDKMKELAEKL